MENETCFQDLSNFNPKRILSENSQRKLICVEGEFSGKEGNAIVLLEKKAFTEANVKLLCDDKSTLKKEFINDVYGSYEFFPSIELNGKFRVILLHQFLDRLITKFCVFQVSRLP